MKIYFDGGCRPNPGIMCHAFITEEGAEYFENTVHGTNNEAEWLACLAACSYAVENDLKNVEIIGDSLLVINQIMGKWQIKQDAFRPFLSHINDMRKQCRMVFSHIPRGKNLAGKLIERKYKEEG